MKKCYYAVNVFEKEIFVGYYDEEKITLEEAFYKASEKRGLNALNYYVADIYDILVIEYFVKNGVACDVVKKIKFTDCEKLLIAIFGLEELINILAKEFAPEGYYLINDKKEWIKNWKKYRKEAIWNDPKKRNI